MNDSGVNNLIAIMASPLSRIRFYSYPAIIHVARADMDETYGAYVAAGNNTSGDIAWLAG